MCIHLNQNGATIRTPHFNDRKMKTIILLTAIALTGCSKPYDCYLCEKDSKRLRFCEDSFYSPNGSLDETISGLRGDGYNCDYYVK